MNRFFTILWTVVLTFPVFAADPEKEAPPSVSNPVPPGVSTQQVEQIVESTRESIAVIRFTGRDGKQEGMGTGFVIGAEGLIATNLHVLGEGRPISVELFDGRKFDVKNVLASDKSLDLALIEIDAKELKPLELADSDTLKQGEAVVAIGNPLGLVRSVVTGLLSARRDEEPSLQLSMPIVPGNSGGPVLDLHGNVHGIISQRSLREANVGYAVTINSLKPLIEKPNPIAMSSWLTIGALDAADWNPLFGARWSQRAGRILVSGMGSGFGGRSICLWKRPIPEQTFELAVKVRLNDENGAAGLIFHGDGEHRHYGFYPSAGSLRLSRFDGPDVFSWKILDQVQSPHYRPGDWNELKVRLEKDKMSCYVNGELAIESTDTVFAAGQIGLAKFRDTEAEFKNFQVAEEIQSTKFSDELVKDIQDRVMEEWGNEPSQDLIDKWAPDADAALYVLEQEAKKLEAKAQKMRDLAIAVHQQNTREQLLTVLEPEQAGQPVDLLRAALLLARLDNPEVDADSYVVEVERMVREIEKSLPENANTANRLDALNHYLFKEQGFHGSRNDYYNRSNSYVNEVIDDREGLPITLSVLYMELGRRLGVRVVGVPLPGHFIVRYEPTEGEQVLIDVFEGGEKLTRLQAEQTIFLNTGRPAEDRHFEATTSQAIVKRMIYNLVGVAEKEKDREGMLRYLDTLVALDPQAARERWMRAILRMQTDRKQGARQDADWLLENSPEGIDLDQVHHLRQLLDQ